MNINQSVDPPTPKSSGISSQSMEERRDHGQTSNKEDNVNVLENHIYQRRLKKERIKKSKLKESMQEMQGKTLTSRQQHDKDLSSYEDEEVEENSILDSSEHLRPGAIDVSTNRANSTATSQGHSEGEDNAEAPMLDCTISDSSASTQGKCLDADGTYLIKAVLVPDNLAIDMESGDVCGRVLVKAEIFPELQWKRRIVATIALLLCVAVLLVVLILLMVRKDNEGSSETSEISSEIPFESTVTVIIQLDELANETSWELVCNGTSLTNGTRSGYIGFQLVRDTFSVKEFDICEFHIHDTAGDGLCCVNGQGFYQVLVGGATLTPEKLRAEGAEFGFNESATFLVSRPWNTVGRSIIGKKDNAHAGWSLKLSGDGSTVAVGAPGLVSFTYGSTEIGYVQVYRRGDSDDWVQLGADISDPKNEGGFFGFSLDLSDDGNILAVGAPFTGMLMQGSVRVYEFDADADTWIQMGEDILGTEFSNSAFSLSLSSDGTTLAIGAPPDGGSGETAGSAYVYKFLDGSWTLLGAPIVGDNEGDKFGVSVALNGRGDMLAVGAAVPFVDSHGGYVRVFRYTNDLSPNWVQVGHDLTYAHGRDDWFGFTVFLSDSGRTLAVGAPGHFDYINPGEGNSYVRVFTLESQDGNEEVWTLRGQELRGKSDGDNFGIAIALSKDGNLLAVGAPFYQAGSLGKDSGAVQTFTFDGESNSWITVGQAIVGNSTGMMTGWSVSLATTSADRGGTMLAVGSTRYTTNSAHQAGLVWIYSKETQ